MEKMRRKDREMTKQEVDEFLISTMVIRIGVVADNIPYIVPLNFIYIGDSIYFHSAKKGRKLLALETLQEICIEADELISIKHEAKACNFSCYYKSVIGYGKPFIVNKVSDKVEILNKLTQKYSDTKFEPVTENEANFVAVYGIKINSVCGKKNIAS